MNGSKPVIEVLIDFFKKYNIMNRFILVLIFTMSIAYTSIGQDINKSKLAEKVNWKSFVSKKCSIKYPSEWTLDDSGLMGSHLFLFSPLDSINDDFRENVNIMIQDISAYKLTLEDYAKISEEQILKLATNSEIIESEKVKINNEEFHKLIYKADQGIYHLKFEQYYWIKNNEAFVITLTCKESEFEEYKQLGEEILNSFKLPEAKKDKKM